MATEIVGSKVGAPWLVGWIRGHISWLVRWIRASCPAQPKSARFGIPLRTRIIVGFINAMSFAADRSVVLDAEIFVGIARMSLFVVVSMSAGFRQGQPKHFGSVPRCVLSRHAVLAGIIRYSVGVPVQSSPAGLLHPLLESGASSTTASGSSAKMLFRIRTLTGGCVAESTVPKQ
jgi:hypothetical protein